MTILAGLVLVPMATHAQEETSGPDTTAAKPVVHHKTPKKPAVKATMPAGPVPYTTLNPAVAGPTHAVPPLVVAVPVAPAVVVAAPVDVPPPPPPPPPAMMAPAQPQAPAPPVHPAEINLRCDTVTTDGKKTLTRGTFFIDLFPSPVFPDRQADFKFEQVEPQHTSLVRDSICMDALCDATVSGSAYYLVNKVTRNGAALRITLNRANGAFYAEEITPRGLTHGGDHLGESGTCTPQKLPDALF